MFWIWKKYAHSWKSCNYYYDRAKGLVFSLKIFKMSHEIRTTEHLDDDGSNIASKEIGKEKIKVMKPNLDWSHSDLPIWRLYIYLVFIYIMSRFHNMEEIDASCSRLNDQSIHANKFFFIFGFSKNMFSPLLLKGHNISLRFPCACKLS